ncbi:hypothetical protein J132_09375 [Termitomyces sp. J132]|nr:hypothetical protein J132_09375 [Termitomyces sp. J132]
MAASASKGKGKATASLPLTPAQGSGTLLLTAWKTVEQCFSAKEKGKGKAKEPEPSTVADEQLAHLFQWLHEARVPEDIGADILNNPVVQLTLSQVLDKLDIGKQVTFPPQPPEAKKAHTEPSVFVKGSLTQRVPLLPYDDDMPASDDWRMDEYPDFEMSPSTAGPLKLAVAKAGPPKPAAAKAGLSRPATVKAGSAKPATTLLVAANSMVIATPIVFLANVPQESEVGMIKVLKPRTYNIPTSLSHEYFPPVHCKLCDAKFFVTKVQAA